MKRAPECSNVESIFLYVQTPCRVTLTRKGVAKFAKGGSQFGDARGY